jgi:hypothetical protein
MGSRSEELLFSFHAPRVSELHNPKDTNVARAVAERVEAAWAEASAEASRPLFVPTGVAAEAHRQVKAAMELEGGECETGRRGKKREGRYGAVFGEP